MDNILDHVVVQGQRYDIVSPTAFGDYIETIGSACINPDGYAQGSTFLARLGNEQFYYEATAAITQGSAILEGTNCKKTTVTGREAELALEIETLGDNVTSLSEALTNLKSDLTSINQTGTTASQAISKKTYFYLNGALVKAKVDIANGATFTLNTNYEVVTNGGFNDLLNNIYTVIDTMPTTENTDKAVSGCPLGYILIGADVYNSSLSRWDSLPIGIFSDRPAYMTSYTDSSYTYARVYLKAGGGTAYGGQTFRAKFIKV